MSHPFIGGVIAVVANKLADEYVKKKGALEIVKKVDC
jgi:hypothetical protein